LFEHARGNLTLGMEMAKTETRDDRSTIPASYFDFDEMQKLASRYRSDFRTARPFPHAVIDDLLPAEELDLVLDEFLQAQDETWHRFDNPREKKLAERRETSFGPFTRHLLAAKFNSSVFLEFLESLTGIPGLIPDPYYEGGGLHQIVRGGFLKVHADFNWHEHLKLDRRLNVIVYLNRDWKEEYGGHLELWNRDMTRCERRVLPIFNRCVIFGTTDFSYHGHPEPLTCPEGVTRKSLALYYYSNGRPADELTDAHSTLFQSRPGEVMRRDVKDLGRTPKAIAQGLLPPIIVNGIKALQQRKGRR
jgi:Rps23 Pro-64 3,4-dihydroxylase Tpa1-like proline 4-hydroxylase